ncbi:MAG: hypothetical protein DRP62_00070 [Planctomycetota bacterium]|nr:MAG: hypothetical protein DRP62_00070 [Planctomycetota bacterium]
MTFKSLLNTTVTILSRTPTINELGERIYSWSSGSSIEARIVPITIEERLTLSGEYEHARYKGFLPSSASITEKDRLIWGNKTLEVLAVYSDSSHHHKTVILREIEG